MWSCSFKMLVQLIESFQRLSMIVNAAKVLLPLQIVLFHNKFALTIIWLQILT